MCGVAAFSKPAGSTINARALSHALLTQIEIRGSHAAGYAWSTTDGQTGVYKDGKPGSQLTLGVMPRDAETVILHTRFATQGSPADNRNNHPVMSPSGNIAMVHNGVITNDKRLRRELGIPDNAGEVDSLVIPAVLEADGYKGFSRLGGYAALAWIDSRTPSLLQIAKLKNSPVAYTSLYDGTFVMASTESILTDALDSLGIFYGGVFTLGERRMLTVENGFIMDHMETVAMSYDAGAYSRYGAATSGTAKSSPVTGATRGFVPNKSTISSEPPVKADATPKVTTDIAKITGSEDKAPEGSCAVDVDAYMADLEEWRSKQDAADEAGPAVLSGFIWDDDNDDYYIPADEGMSRAEIRMANAAIRKYLTEAEDDGSIDTMIPPAPTGGYYAVDHDGDTKVFPNLDDLEKYLKMLGKMTRTTSDLWPGLPDDEHWVNYIQDVGAIGEGASLISFVDDMGNIDEHESPAVRHLDYLRHGAGHLTALKGA